MPRIPKNLSDKDMVRGFVEEETLADHFARVEKEEKKERKGEAAAEPPLNLARAGFTPVLMDDLGRALMQLKMELFREGVKNYTFKITRQGERIVLTPKYRN